MSITPYTGLYINLDRSPERRIEFEEQLRTYNIFDRYVRFPAIDGTLIQSPQATVTPGEVGCFLSHYRALEHAKVRGLPVHVVEDDTLMSAHVEGFATTAVASGHFNKFDVIFTDTYVHANPFTLRFLKEGMDQALDGQGQLRPDFNVQLFGLAMMELTGTSSYFVGANSIDRVLMVLKAELDAGPRMPLDYCFRAAVDRGTLKVACTMPFLTTIRLESIVDSTISRSLDRRVAFDFALQTLLRYSFFIKRDLQDYAMPYFLQIIGPCAKRDPHQSFMAAVLSAILSGPTPADDQRARGDRPKP